MVGVVEWATGRRVAHRRRCKVGSMGAGRRGGPTLGARGVWSLGRPGDDRACGRHCQRHCQRHVYSHTCRRRRRCRCRRRHGHRDRQGGVLLPSASPPLILRRVREHAAVQWWGRVGWRVCAKACAKACVEGAQRVVSAVVMLRQVAGGRWSVWSGQGTVVGGLRRTVLASLSPVSSWPPGSCPLSDHASNSIGSSGRARLRVDIVLRTVICVGSIVVSVG